MPCANFLKGYLMKYNVRLLLAVTLLVAVTVAADETPTWEQWRGPTRDGIVTAGPEWPAKLSGGRLKPIWSVKKLSPSYSGPIVSKKMVFTTETVNGKDEIVRAFDRANGNELWKSDWAGAVVVPFFAWSNGSWIRSTPAFDGQSLYVAGMRDVLVSLDATTGKENWRMDFMKEFKSPQPAFGFVCSPLVDGDFVYVQAGASLVCLDKNKGHIVWRSMKDEGGMNGSAFSSPTIATLAGKRQLLVQSRKTLAGVELSNGTVIWSKDVPAYQGMNILTPVAFEDNIFTSTYQNKSWLFKITQENEKQSISESWNLNLAGYMSTPVVIDGHAYIHLQNQRFACIDLKTGQKKWLSGPYGQYCSLVAKKDRILALDERGRLLLIAANPNQFTLLDSFDLEQPNMWAHLSVCGDEIFIRSLVELMAFKWQELPTK